MLFDQFNKYLTNICFNILAEWWIEPYYLPISVSVAVFIWCCIHKGCCVSFFLYGIFVENFYVIKLILVARKIINSFIDDFRKFFDYWWWVIGFVIDVKRIAVWFSNSKILSCFQIKFNA